MTLPIDVGVLATDKNATTGAVTTYINAANPANLSGLITSIDVWAQANITELRVGIFRLVSGTTFICIASATIGNVTAGSAVTVKVNLPVKAGDLIGAYWATGAMECRTVVGTGMYYKTGEYIDAGDSASYSLVSTQDISLYGQGIVRGWWSK